jgi:hypothetical protein
MSWRSPPKSAKPRPRLINMDDAQQIDIEVTKKLPCEGFKRPWPPLIKMDAAVKANVEKLFNP